ncbi:hypothetical protein CQA40_08715 [Helicobacter sp. MIT 01-3238]|nr:hypothetical protein CQA40_08715 [Helicobacter sp. MIT 01-3238]
MVYITHLARFFYLSVVSFYRSHCDCTKRAQSLAQNPNAIFPCNTTYFFHNSTSFFCNVISFSAISFSSKNATFAWWCAPAPQI